jgi:hypothetical protein
MTLLLTRSLKANNIGLDVEGCRRALIRYLKTGTLAQFTAKPDAERRRMDPWAIKHLELAQQKAGLPVDRVFGPKVETSLRAAGAFDAYADSLLIRYAEDHAEPPLVQPKQGWNSLHKSLWPIYSYGRHAGLTDLGTYNPASTLPSGRPSDHAVLPAFACDLGIDPDTGWYHPAGRAVFMKAMSDPAVEYVILGNRIGFRSSGTIRTYTSGGHLNHLHISGNR